MVRPQLNSQQWARIEELLASRGPGRPPKDNRKFIEAVLWWRRTGVPWRDLPDEFGPSKTVFNRFDRWSKKGKWVGCSRSQIQLRAELTLEIVRIFEDLARCEPPQGHSEIRNDDNNQGAPRAKRGCGRDR